MSSRIKQAFLKSFFSLLQSLPTLISTLLLVSFFVIAIPETWYSKIFTNSFFDPIIGAFLGSITFGNPVNSFVVGGELLSEGVSMYAVTAFMIAWVTVGVIQMPAEITYFGIKKTLLRNSLAFVFSVLASMITVFLYSL